MRPQTLRFGDLPPPVIAPPPVDLDMYFSDQLRALIQGVPIFPPKNPGAPLPAKNIPVASPAKPGASAVMPTPLLDENAYRDLDTLRGFLARVGREASGDLVPTLLLLQKEQWHPTVCWLAQPGGLPWPPLTHWSKVPFPMSTVASLKASILPDIKATIQAIQARQSPPAAP